MTTHTTPLETPQIKSDTDAEVSAADRAMGAAMIASGIGSLVLGITIILAEVNANIQTFLIWHSGAGPLSGKTSISVIAFVVGWIVLHYVFKRKAVSLTTSFVITLILLVLGLLLTFPPVFVSLAG